MDIPLRLRLEGLDADNHQIPGYDGYTALAGFALTLALVTNYAATGTIRHRGDFVGRHAVKARPIASGSVLLDFFVTLDHQTILGVASVTAASATAFFYELAKRTIDGNIGTVRAPDTDQFQKLVGTRQGDLDALVAATEPSVRQSHFIIGTGARAMNIYGGSKILNKYDFQTKNYVNDTITDPNIVMKDVSVSSFNVNSGHGGIYDHDLNRVVPIRMNREILQKTKNVFSWGLDQYANGTGKYVTATFYRELAIDNRVKSYAIVDAEIPPK